MFYCVLFICFRKTESFQVISMAAVSNRETDTQKFVMNSVTPLMSVSATVWMLFVVSSPLASSHLFYFFLLFYILGQRWVRKVISCPAVPPLSGLQLKKVLLRQIPHNP